MSEQLLQRVRHLFFIQDQKLKQLEHNQLPRYYQLWVRSMEALFTGLALGLVVIGGGTLLTEGFSEAAAISSSIFHVGFAGALLVTVFLRGAWFLTAGLMSYRQS